MMAMIKTWIKRLAVTWPIVLVAISLCACTAENSNDVFKRNANRFDSKNTLQRMTETATRHQEDHQSPPKINIHFSAKYCLECHVTRKIDRKTKSLKYNGDFRRLCLDCHNERQPIHFHPLQIQPDASSGVKIPAGFPLQQDKLDCLTCHDIFLQCRDSEADKLLLKGQMLLRGMPYKNRLAFCFRCHDESRYPRRNPHQQIDTAGKVIQNACLYCHTTVPDASHATYREVKLIGNYGELCKGCHYLTAKQPLHVRHLRKPTLEVVQRMKQMQAEFKIVLPLDQDGKVTCVTCHNPHQKGLIPDQRAGSTGAGASHRHRLAGNMCIKCHPMR
jgi:hypothetical protein